MLDWLRNKNGRETVEERIEKTASEVSFPHGMEARLAVRFQSGRRIGRVQAFFRHEADPYARLLAFVETEDQRRSGSKTGMTLVSWLSDDLPTGRYVLAGIAGVYLGGKKHGEEFLFASSPSASFVLTDRKGNVAAPKQDAPRVTGLGWE